MDYRIITGQIGKDAAQSLVVLSTVALVVARAVNVLSYTATGP